MVRARGAVLLSTTLHHVRTRARTYTCACVVRARGAVLLLCSARARVRHVVVQMSQCMNIIDRQPIGDTSVFDILVARPTYTCSHDGRIGRERGD
jgi:hypothetical protein